MSVYAPVEPSVTAMTGLLTLPFRRGGETLVIPLGADDAQGTAVAPYNFNNYLARYGAAPALPRYILVLKQGLGDDALIVSVDYTVGVAPVQTVQVRFEPHTLPGSSAVIAINDADVAAAVVRKIRQSPPPLPGAGAAAFSLVALLGNIAKLTWAVSWEKDQIRQHLLDVQRQRILRFARGASLDHLGTDLGVSRFPPREHSFDPQTIALYHCNDAIAPNGVLADETRRFGLAGHDGANQGAVSVANGKFGRGLRFDGAASGVSVPSDAAFNVAANGAFTVEAFVVADPVAGATPDMIVSRGVVANDGTLNAAGWWLGLVNGADTPNAVRWSLSDGAASVNVVSDISVADGRVHHVAGVLDRVALQARIYVDGDLHGSRALGNLGAIQNNEALRIGRSAAGHFLAGTLDEIRISGAARSDFHPVLGESDPAYRLRLGVFEQWLLPSPDRLLDAINSRVQINGQARSFVLVETPRPGAAGSKIVRVFPAHIVAGQSIGADGALNPSESSAAGSAADDTDFDDRYLLVHNRANVDYGANPDHHRMQARTAAVLDALIDAIAALQPPVAGPLLVDRAYDAGGPGLHAVGRALELRHAALGADRLAVLAHRAGFDSVFNGDPTVHVAVVAGEKLAISIEPRPPLNTPPAPIDVFAGQAIDLDALPALPSTGEFQWSMVAPAAAAARFVAHPADNVNLRTAVIARPRLRLVADAPGDVAVRVEYRSRGRTVSGSRRIRIGIDALADGASIAGDGRRNASEADASGTLQQPIKPIYLVTSNIAGVDYGANANNKRMHAALERTLRVMVASTANLNVGLGVVQAFDPAALDLHAAGRAVLMTHNAVAPETLGAIASRAGFDFVRRNGAQIHASVADDTPIEIVRTGTLALEEELVQDTAVDLHVRPEVLPNGTSFQWAVQSVGRGAGAFDFVLRPQVRFTPRRPGLLALELFVFEADANAVPPYSFEIRLDPALEAANAIVSKPQYDLLMNILNYFHPIGVEVLTTSIRRHVVEVEQNPQAAFPDYTYPHFRQ
jgi:hypothetical protein